MRSKRTHSSEPNQLDPTLESHLDVSDNDPLQATLNAEENNAVESDEGAWIFAYADMVTLLLLFFVMMFSVSKVSEDKMEDLKESLKSEAANTKISERSQKLKGIDEALKKMAEQLEIEHQTEEELEEIIEQLTQAGNHRDARVVALAGSILKDLDSQSLRSLARKQKQEDVKKDFERLTSRESRVDQKDLKSKVPDFHVITLSFLWSEFFDNGSERINKKGQEQLQKLGDYFSTLTELERIQVEVRASKTTSQRPHNSIYQKTAVMAASIASSFQKMKKVPMHLISASGAGADHAIGSKSSSTPAVVQRSQKSNQEVLFKVRYSIDEVRR